MSPTRTDDDLERLLRTTLTTQARTVDHGPNWSSPVDAGRRRSPASRRQWAAAVAAVCVLGLVATLAIVHAGGRHRSTPPGGLPASAFTSFDVTGYKITSRETLGDGARSVTVRTPNGEPGGDVAVTLWAPHTYTFARLTDQVIVPVSGHRGYAGVDGTEQYRGHDRPMHSVVWKFAPDQWAVAQQIGNIHRVPRPAQILAVARATRPGQHLALTTPFRLAAVPAGYSLDQVIVPSSHVVFLLLHAGRERSLELVAQPASGHLSDAHGVVYRHGEVAVSIDAIGPSGRPQSKALARQAGRHIVWGTTDLSRIVP